MSVAALIVITLITIPLSMAFEEVGCGMRCVVWE